MRALFRSIAAMVSGPLIVSAASGAELKIVTATTPLAALVRTIGSDAVEVRSLTHGAQDPHYTPAKPSLMRAMRDADGMVYNGLQLEIGWLPLLLEGSRNPRLRPGSRRLLDASVGIAILEIPSGELSRAQGDIHPDGNPHYQLDPRIYLTIAGSVAAWLGEMEPDRMVIFEERLAAFRADFEARIVEWERQLAPLRGTPIVAYHKQWEYLAGWLALRILGYVENKPGTPPSPRHLRDLEAIIRSERPAFLLSADFIDPSIPRRVGERTDVPVLILPTAPGSAPGTDTLETFFDHLVTRLVSAIP
jgi:zinc/manganese transport system substrate-binding protein